MTRLIKVHATFFLMMNVVNSFSRPFRRVRNLQCTMSTQIHTLGAKEKLRSCLKESLMKSFGDLVTDVNPVIETSSKPEFGDYQCNIAMPLSKKLKMKPVDIATKLISAIDSDILSELSIAGPGFINMRLSQVYIKNQLIAKLKDPLRLNIGSAVSPQRVVIDFSSPNIAKEMHVGHLRSTIIGDCLSRLLEFLGHDVLRINHVGDWGTQFGMLIRHLKETAPAALLAPGGEEDDRLALSIGDLAQFYKDAKKHFDSDLAFQNASRLEVVRLQSGDPESLRVWRAFCQCSRLEFEKIYSLLSVQLTERGESFYNPMLPAVVGSLREKGLAVESDGAQVVYLPGYKNRAGDSLPLMVTKSDGGFLYATTDLAALQHRATSERADRVLYVTDAGQAQHFQMVFDAARLAGFVGEGVELRHVPFGVVQGEDGQKLKSRSGDTVKLRELLSEAIRLAREDMLKRKMQQGSVSVSVSVEGTASASVGGEGVGVGVEPVGVLPVQELDESELDAALAVGIGAVKYADLSMNRESDYRFSFDKMLALTGNTAPYMMYAYARIRGIRRRAEEELRKSASGSASESASGSGSDVAASTVTVASGAGGEAEGGLEISLDSPEEEALARQLLRLEDVLREVEASLYPNKVCEYLFELSQRFNQFYEKCPVLRAESRALQLSRSALCSITADTLSLCLGLLGIRTVDKL